MFGVSLESSWVQDNGLLRGGRDFGLVRPLEAKNILRLLQVLPVLFIAFHNKILNKFDHVLCKIAQWVKFKYLPWYQCYIAAMLG